MAVGGAKTPAEMMKDRMAAAAAGRVSNVSDGRIKGQFNLAKKTCLHSDWDQLASALSLHHTDIPALKQRVTALGLQEPKRLRPKNKPTD